MRWAEYAEAARRLSEIRTREETRQSQVRHRVAAGRAAVEQLQRRLAAQRDHLVGHSARLGGLICFGGNVGAWILFLAAAEFLRT